MSVAGVDYAWGRPGGAALKKAGKVFACRYLSYDTSKNLTKAEAADLAAHDVWSVVVWETTAQRPLAGKAAGVADAKAAKSQAAKAGMPAGRPVYFAVDFDTSEAQQKAVNAYLSGAAEVLGKGSTGVYGGYYTVKRALDAGVCSWAWQTIAWSGGQWDKRVHIRQGAIKTIAGVSCDLDTGMTSDYGQWMPGKTPEEEPVTPDDARMIAKAVLNQDDLIDSPSGLAAQSDSATNHFYAPKTALHLTMQHSIEANKRVQDMAADVSALAAGGLSEERLTALGNALASNTYFLNAIGAAVADALSKRMT